MTVADNQHRRKSVTNQDINGKSTNGALGQNGKFRVRRPPADLWVKLHHSFLRAWCSVLPPYTFMVFCLLEMFADFVEGWQVPADDAGNGLYRADPRWEPNPLYGHTNGFHSVAEVADLTGASTSAVRRAVTLLVHYGLVSYQKPEMTERRREGVAVDWIVHQDVRPPTGRIELTDKGLQADVGAPTSTIPQVNNESVPLSPVTEGVCHQRKRSTVTSDRGGVSPVIEVDAGASLSSSISVLRGGETSSSLAFAETPPPPPAHLPTDQPKTTPPGKPPAPTHQPASQLDLTPLKVIDGHWLDDDAIMRLWQGSVAVAPDITVNEVRQCASSKASQANLDRIGNPVGFLITAVPNALASGWHLKQRQERAEARAEIEATVRRREAEATAWAEYEAGRGASPFSGRTKAENEERQRKLAEERQRKG